MIDETKDKFTPGPWDLCSMNDIDEQPDIVGPDGRFITGVGSSRADARLIAASPDMLAALVLCVENYEYDMREAAAWQMLHIGKVELPPSPYHIMAARAAIAKAREG